MYNHNNKSFCSLMCSRELKQSDVTLCRRVPKYAFVTLRNGKNEKFYVKLHSEEALNMKVRFHFLLN